MPETVEPVHINVVTGYVRKGRIVRAVPGIVEYVNLSVVMDFVHGLKIVRAVLRTVASVWAGVGMAPVVRLSPV